MATVGLGKLAEERDCRRKSLMRMLGPNEIREREICFRSSVICNDAACLRLRSRPKLSP